MKHVGPNVQKSVLVMNLFRVCLHFEFAVSGGFLVGEMLLFVKGEKRNIVKLSFQSDLPSGSLIPECLSCRHLQVNVFMKPFFPLTFPT